MLALVFALFIVMFASSSFATALDYQYSDEEGRTTIQGRLGYSLFSEEQSYKLDGVAVGAETQTEIPFFSNTLNFELEGRRFFTPHFSFSSSLGYVLGDTQTLTGTLSGTSEEDKVSLYPITATLQYHFAPYGAFRPYLGAGYHYTIIGNGFDTLAFDSAATGLVLQGGFDLWFDAHWGVNFDVKNYTMSMEVDTQNLTNVNLIGDVDVNLTTISTGVSYRF